MICAKKLDFAYPGNDDIPATPVFRGLDLTIEPGTFVAVLGHNGCGKSTLAKHFNAILLSSGGSVHVCGMDFSAGTFSVFKVHIIPLSAIDFLFFL